MFPLPYMQVSTKRVSPVMLEMSVQVPADAVKAEFERAYQTLARKARIRGFRPGKAPREVLARIYGPQVMGDVMNAIIQTTLPKALAEKSVTPISQPQVDPGKVDAKEDFSYVARFEVTPDVADVKHEGFALKRPKTEVTDAMVDAEIRGRASPSRDAQDPRAVPPREEGGRRHHRLHAVGRRQGSQRGQRPGRAD